MRARTATLILIGAHILSACEERFPAPEGARQIGLTKRGEALFLKAHGVGPETDELPLFDLQRGGKTIATNIRAAAVDRGTLAIVDHNGVLFEQIGDRRVVLFDGANGTPAILPDGSIVCSRLSDEPGETDLWIAKRGEAPRAIDPRSGFDDLPVALPDGRVLFVSGRSSVASWWWVDPTGGEAEQLTNHGLVAGKPLIGFVPPAAERAEVLGGVVRYDAGGDRWFELDLATRAVRGVTR